MKTAELRASLGAMQHQRRPLYGGYFSSYHFLVLPEFWFYE
jgi:hypothetical protein